MDDSPRAPLETLHALLNVEAGNATNRWLDVEELTAWGRALGAALPRPSTVTLTGDLGTGKTTLARAICAGLGVFDLDTVTSPTYALVHEYDAPQGPIVHADLYRLHTVAELESLGWDELVASAKVLLVEWPALAHATLPSTAIHVVLRHDPERPDGRWLHVDR